MAGHDAVDLTSRMAQRTSTGRRRSSCSVPEVLTCSAGARGLLTSAWFLWRARAQEYWTRFGQPHDCSRMAHQHITGRRHKQLRAQLVLHCEGRRARKRGRPLQRLNCARLAWVPPTPARGAPTWYRHGPDCSVQPESSQLLQVVCALLRVYSRWQPGAVRRPPGMAMPSCVTVSRSADEAVRAPVVVAVGGSEWSRAMASSPVRPS